MKPTDLSISTGILAREAISMGFELEIYSRYLIKVYSDSFQFYIKGSRSPLQSAQGEVISVRKELAKEILLRNNIPTAKCVMVQSKEDLDKLNSLNFPLVAKPSTANQGRLVQMNISTLDEAREYLRKNADYLRLPDNECFLFEEQLQGEEYRFLCINQKCLSIIHRVPANISGDGVHSIADLISIENKARADREMTALEKIVIDDDLKAIVKNQGFTLETIPKQNQQVWLRTKSNVSQGGVPHEVSEKIHPDIIAAVEKAAAICELDVAGADVMFSDPSKPLHEQPHSGIIEINSSPSLDLHHFPETGKPFNAARSILEHTLEFKDYLQEVNSFHSKER